MEGKLFSRVYLQTTGTIKDSVRFRNRLAAYVHDNLNSDYAYKVIKYVYQETGSPELSRAIYMSDLVNFFTKAQIREKNRSVPVFLFRFFYFITGGKMKKALLAITAAALLSGCTTRLTDFTVISTKNIDLSRGADFIRGESRVVGEDTKHIIIFIPTGIPNAKEAADKAIESTPGAVALLDGVIEHEWFYFPYIYGYTKYRVKGTPLIDPKLNNKL